MHLVTRWHLLCRKEITITKVIVSTVSTLRWCSRWEPIVTFSQQSLRVNTNSNKNFTKICRSEATLTEWSDTISLTKAIFSKMPALRWCSRWEPVATFSQSMEINQKIYVFNYYVWAGFFMVVGANSDAAIAQLLRMQ